MAKILTINYYEYEPATSKYSIGDRDIAFMYLGNNAVGSFSVQLSNSEIIDPGEINSQYATFNISSSDSSESGGDAAMDIRNYNNSDFIGDTTTLSRNPFITFSKDEEEVAITLQANEYNGYFTRWIFDFEYTILEGGDISSSTLSILVNVASTRNTYNIVAQFSAEDPEILY